MDNNVKKKKAEKAKAEEAALNRIHDFFPI